MKLGKVKVISEYIVDLDNDIMVQNAKDALFDDFYHIFVGANYDEFDYVITIEECKELTEKDITSFLQELDKEINEEEEY